MAFFSDIEKNTKLDNNDISKYIFSKSPMKIESKQRSINNNKVHFRHQRKILRKMQFSKMFDLGILLDCGHPIACSKNTFIEPYNL